MSGCEVAVCPPGVLPDLSCQSCALNCRLFLSTIHKVTLHYIDITSTLHLHYIYITYTLHINYIYITYTLHILYIYITYKLYIEFHCITYLFFALHTCYCILLCDVPSLTASSTRRWMMFGHIHFTILGVAMTMARLRRSDSPKGRLLQGKFRAAPKVDEPRTRRFSHWIWVWINTY